MMRQFTWANFAFKVKFAVAGYRALTPETARRSFFEAGLWVMNFQFLKRIASSQDSENFSGLRSNSQDTRSNLAVHKAQSGAIRRKLGYVVEKIKYVFEGNGSASNALAEIQEFLKNSFTVKSLLDN